MNSIPKLCINGWAGHGKDTVAEMLVQEGWEYVSPSARYAETLIFPWVQEWWRNYISRPSRWVMPDIGPYETVEDCLADRVNHRPQWAKLIADKLASDPEFHNRVMDGSEIYTGHRRGRELDAMRPQFDLTVWVQDPRKPREPASSMDFDNISYPHDYVIMNDGTLDDLRHRVREFATWAIQASSARKAVSA